MKYNFKLLQLNKKGDFASIVYIVMFLVILGIVLFLLSKVNTELFLGIEQSVMNNTKYNNTVAHNVTTAFREQQQSRIWDWAFLAIFLGCLVAIGLSAFAVRISPIFYWIYGILSLIVLIMGGILSNIWQTLAEEPDMAETLTSYPIMNSLLGTYYPLVVVVVVLIFMLVLFGKPPEGGEPAT